MGIPSIQLTTGKPYQKAGQRMLWLADSSGQLSISDIQQAGYQHRFSQGLHDIGAFGLFNGAIWAHGSFSSPAPGKVYLLVEFANIDSITLYYYDGPVIRSITSGSRVSPRNNVWNLPGFSFELPALGDRQQEFWLRIRTGNAVIVPVTLATEQGVWQALGGMYVVELVYLGIVIALFCYNLSLFIWIGDRSYVYYLGYLFFLAAFVLLYLRGFHVVFPEPVSRALNLYGIGFVAPSYLFAIPFSITFLNGRSFAPRITAALKVFFVVCLAAVACCLAGWRHATIRLQELVSVCVPVLFIAMAVMSYRRGHKPAMYFLVAWTLLLGTIVLFTLINTGLLPLRHWFFHILPAGSAMEVILLSLALGYRYSQLKKEKMAETESKLQIIRDQNILLERKVEERTRALKESNQVKNKLIGIISHDLRTPLNNLSGLLELSEKKALSAGEVQHFSRNVRQNIKYIAGTIQNILNWSLTQMEGIETRPRKVKLGTLAYLVVDTYRFAADQKAILLRNPIPEAMAVKADYHQLELVLRNLVDNAIKFTPQGGIVTVGCRQVDEGVEVFVSDTGKGMTVEEIQCLLYGTSIYSTEGTDEERGTGLGLQLCKEFIANNGGALRINSKPGKGTEFYFVLPRWE